MIKNIFANWSVIVVSALSVFFLYPFLISQLGDENYGIWLLITAVMGYCWLLQLGLPLTSVRFMTEALAQKNNDKYQRILNTSFAYFMGISVLIALGSVIGSYVFLDFYAIPEELEKVVQIVFILAGLEMSTRFFFQIFESALYASEKFVWLAAIKNIAAILRVALCFMFVRGEDGLLMVVLTLIATTLLQGILFFVIAKWFNPYLKINIYQVSKKEFTYLVSFSFFVFLSHLAGRISQNSDPLVIGAVVSVSSIVVFSIANRIVLYLAEFMEGISVALMPKLMKIHSDAEQSTERMGETYLQYSRYVAYFIIWITIPLFYYVEAFFRLWVGEEYSVDAANVFFILAAGNMIYLIQRSAASPVFLVKKVIRFPVYVSLGSSIVNVVLSIILGKSHGLIGVAIGTAIPTTFAAIITLVYANYQCNTSILKYIYKVIFFPACSALLFIIPLGFLPQPENINNYFELIFSSFVMCSFYIVGWLLLFSTKEEKERFLRTAKSLVHTS